MSGRPVEPDIYAQYMQEFQAEFDKIQAEAGPDMLLFHSKLQELDKQLNIKYSNFFNETVPQSNKAWRTLIKKYDAPLMLALSAENPNELILVVMDQPLN